MADSMAGKVALVTGGSSGIGKATALAFAQEGARVAIASRGQERGEERARAIRDAGGEAIWIGADVTQEAQVQAMVRQVVEAYGRSGRPEEVAQAVVRLCSEKASLVTGMTLAVGGEYLDV